MAKPYTDLFKVPLSKQDVATAVRVILDKNSAGPSLLQRRLKIGYGKAASIIDLLEDAGVVSLTNGSKPRVVILKTEATAINAALRQLKKGMR